MATNNPINNSLPFNTIQIFVSQAIGNDSNIGSYTNPLATFGSAITLAGAPPPTQPVIIIGIDGNMYNEQLVINNANVYISAPSAQLDWNGAGDTLTINATGSGTLLNIGSIACTGGGNSIVNNIDETVILKSIILTTGDIVNNGAGIFLIEADLIGVNLTNTSSGNIIYETTIRVGGVDGTGVFGINSLGSTAPTFTINQLISSGLNYPTVDGLAGYVMTTNGAGVLSLQPNIAASAFTAITQQIFTTAGVYTYTPTANMSYCIVEAVGAGGGGGGATAPGGPVVSPGGGGGAGEYVKSIFTAADIAGSQTVTIGAGGIGGAIGENDGATGGNTTFGALMTAVGGVGGDGAGTSLGDSVNGGPGGTGGTGQILIPGNGGGNGYVLYNPTAPQGSVGAGAGSFYGAWTISTSINTNSTIVGLNGLGYGSGASGGGSNGAAQPGATGGNGSDGIVIVTEYIEA